MIRVAVVDDQALVRAGFAMVLGSQEDITVAWEAAHGQEAIDQQTRDPVDVVVMDVQMPVMDGIAATGPITGSGAKVIVVTTFDSSNYVMNALQAGASGFLLKDTPPEEFIEAVRTVGSGSAIISPAATATLIRGLQGENTQPPQEADLGGLIEPLTPQRGRNPPVDRPGPVQRRDCREIVYLHADGENARQQGVEQDRFPGSRARGAFCL